MTTSAFNLVCEYEPRPLGLSTKEPRFSWRLPLLRRGVGQSAYRIRVASTLAGLEAQSAEFWDSGKVDSSRTLHIPYGGKPLQAYSRYFWTVAWWDESGTPMEASPPSEFWTGALNPETDWPAKWITSPAPERYVSSDGPHVATLHEYKAMYFARRFSAYPLDGGASRDGTGGMSAPGQGTTPSIVRAQLCVSAMGVYEAWINGNRVGCNVIDPAATDYSKRVLYTAYDVTRLVEVDNVLILIAGNGRHLDAYGYGVPRVSALLVVELSDGRRAEIAIDGTWVCSSGPIRENGIYYGELYDARLEIPGFATTAQDLSAWKAVVASDGPVPEYQGIETINCTRRIEPVKMWSVGPHRFVYDFGQNFTGVTELSVSGPAGIEVQIKHAELIFPDGSLNTLPNRKAKATDTYILKSEGPERYRPTFTQHGFRYAEISGYPGVPTLESLSGLCFHTAAPEIGEFYCSNDLLNSIHRITRWSQRSNLMGIPTDCPQRDERMGWLGDAQLASEQAIFNFSMARTYTKFLEDIRLSQREDGALSNVAPPYWKLYPADPAWGTAYPVLAWNQYWYYGDQRILEHHYEGICRYLGFLEAQAENGIIHSLGKIGDWCPPGSIGPKRTPSQLTSTWYFYHDTLLVARMAEVLGREKDVERFRRQADCIMDKFNQAFLTDHGYAVNQMTEWDVMPSQTSNLLPLFLDMVPEEAREMVVGRLLESVVKHQGLHLDTGIVGLKYLFDVLTKLGCEEIAYRIATQTSYPGWGYMLREGATTLWERWEKIDGEGMNSNNHIMLGSVDAWFFNTLAGIRCFAPGWEKIEFAPHVVGDLRFVSARTDTLRGAVGISWEWIDPSLHCTIEIPPGSAGRFVLPNVGTVTSIRESGGPFRTSEPDDRTWPEETTPSEAREAAVVLHNLVPGRYSFQIDFADAQKGIILSPGLQFDSLRESISPSQREKE